jgi:hypothetical protein
MILTGHYKYPFLITPDKVTKAGVTHTFSYSLSVSVTSKGGDVTVRTLQASRE